MPSQVLHALFGEDALALAASRGGSGSAVAALWSEAVRGELRPFFFLGCQGPDLFYHNRRRRPVALEYGSLLHRRGFGAAAAALLGAAGAFGARGFPAPVGRGSAGAAYALGFATHALLDRSCHPYIVCKAGSSRGDDGIDREGCHAFFERILDALLIERLRSVPVSSFDQEALLSQPCAEGAGELSFLLAEALRGAYPERALRDGKLADRLANAFADAASFYRGTDPSRLGLVLDPPAFAARLASRDGGAAVALLHPERFPLDLDYLNLARAPWPLPQSAEGTSAASFPDLYGEAVFRGADLFGLLLGGADQGSVAGALGGGGLSLADGAGVPVAPLRTDPLPLPAVLAGQRELRRLWVRSSVLSA